MRLSWLLHRAGRPAEALDLLQQAEAFDAPADVRYLTALIRGRVLQAHRDLPEAEQAYGRALEIWPGSQSARVGLMTVTALQGNQPVAVELADAVIAERETPDPWWSYWLGQSTRYPDLLDALRAARQ
jgi:tetratricopeptide (TPR) repeat protein